MGFPGVHSIGETYRKHTSRLFAVGIVEGPATRSERWIAYIRPANIAKCASHRIRRRGGTLDAGPTRSFRRIGRKAERGKGHCIGGKQGVNGNQFASASAVTGNSGIEFSGSPRMLIGSRRGCFCPSATHLGQAIGGGRRLGRSSQLLRLETKTEGTSSGGGRPVGS